MRGGTEYQLTRTCTCCGFKQTEERQVWGDFDGWSESDKKLPPAQCPVCIHLAKITKVKK